MGFTRDLFGHKIRKGRTYWPRHRNELGRDLHVMSLALPADDYEELKKRAKRQKTTMTKLILKYITWGFMTEDKDI